MTYQVTVTHTINISDDMIAAVVEEGPYEHRIALYRALQVILDEHHPLFATMVNAKRVGDDMIERGLLETDIDRDHRLAAEANAKNLRSTQITELRNSGPFADEVAAIEALKRVIWRNTSGTISTRIAAAVVDDLQREGIVQIQKSTLAEFTHACLSTILGKSITLEVDARPAEA